MDPLWADLINSDWRDHLGSGAREDRLGSDAWLRRFLARTVWSGGRLPGGEGRDALRELRSLLRRIVDSIRAGSDISREDLDALNRVLEAAPVVRRLTQEAAHRSVVLLPIGSGVEAVLGQVAASFVAMLAEGEPQRLKVCANPDCGWVMYDRSRNRTRRWCDATECGNVIKVRRHRSRKRAAAQAQEPPS